MAAEITHILFTDKLFDKYFTDKNRADFYIGCCLPDIRYIDPDISRTSTHLPVESIGDVQQESNSLIAGMKFHNLTDHRRDRFVSVRADVFTAYEKLSFFGGAVKLVEDQILYSRLPDWNRIIQLFEMDIKSPLPANISLARIKTYNQILVEYFRQPATDQTQQILVRHFGFNDQQIDDATRTINRLKSDPAVIATIELMYDHIEDIIIKD